MGSTSKSLEEWLKPRRTRKTKSEKLLSKNQFCKNFIILKVLYIYDSSFHYYYCKSKTYHISYGTYYNVNILSVFIFSSSYIYVRFHFTVITTQLYYFCN